tara:strand:+ start:138 stop:476 length:339 start_codon:yes stop_codon:yes gene_type:complete
MCKIKIFISIIIFSSFLFGTSIIKNETREIEKKIYKISKKISLKEKDINESQLDFSYLTSPSIVEKKAEHLDNFKYLPIKHSNIFLSMERFTDLNNKYVIQKKEYEKKTQKR